MSEQQDLDRYLSATWLRRPGFDTTQRELSAPRARPPRTATGGGSLVSSCDGELRRIALALPASFFAGTDQIMLDDLLRQETLALYASVLSTLPAQCEAVLVSNAYDEAKAFIEAVRPDGPNVVLDAKALGHTTWIRDPFCVVTETAGSRLVEPMRFRDAADAELAERIGVRLGMPTLGSDDLFEGGNVLAGTEHWFLGADSAPSFVTTRDVSAVAAEYGELGAGRRLVLVYSEIAVPPEIAARPRSGKPAEEQLHARNVVGTLQPLFHIDTFMTVALDRNGREVVLLGSPRLAREIIGGEPWPADAALDAQLCSVAEVIRRQADLEIIRIPMPLFAVDTTRKRRWRYATYANALLQRDSAGHRTAWLPTFAGTDDHVWPAAVAIDAEVERIYREDLGYETIHRLPDCRAFAYYLGGPHCVFNYLARS